MKVALVVAALCASCLAAPLPAAAQPNLCTKPAGVYRKPATWAQRLTDPAKIWPLTDGTGQLVAVIGTGVDANNAQFAPGRVVAGSDTTDCDGRGTFAAGIVAARPDPATTFAGMAPGARVLGILYTQTTTGGGPAGAAAADPLAAAIDRATNAGATVILVAVPTAQTSPALTAAVRNALSRNIVVVSPAVGDKPEARSYPASIPGVIGVGAVDSAGAAAQGESGDHVAISAPGTDVVSTSAGTRGVGHLWGVDFPGQAAAAYVAGTVALLRAYRPSLTAAQVLDRLTLTANRPPGGGRDPLLGWGVLDVNAAVTAELAAAETRDNRPSTVVPAAAPPTPQVRQRLPGALATLGVGLAALAVLCVAVIRRGRSRNWQP